VGHLQVLAGEIQEQVDLKGTFMHRISFRPRRAAALLAALCLSVSVAWASPRSDAWKLRATNPTEAARQLEDVVRADPSDAKAHWFLAMIYEDLGRDADGLRALQSARAADPSLGFASSADSVSKLEAALSRGAGGGTSTSNPSSAPVPRSGQTQTRGSGGFDRAEQQQMLGALERQGVYVSPGMASQADARAIEAETRSHPHGAKVLVLDSLPGNAGNIGRFAAQVHKWLKMDDGLLVVATGSPRNVAAYGGFLVNDQPELQKIVQANAAKFTTQGYTQGIIGILNEHEAQEASANRSANTGLLFLIGVPTAGGVWFYRRSKKAKAEREAKAREEASQIANELAPQYEKLDSDFEYAIIAQSDPAKQRELREARAQAGEAFSRSMKQLNAAQDFHSVFSARTSLLQARDQFAHSRAVLEGKPIPAPAMAGVGGGGDFGGGAFSGFGNDGGTGSMLPPGMGRQQANDYEIAPIGADYPGARPGYALDFFTSEPVPIDQMVPVDIDVNGQRKRVWASRDSAQRALSGQPQVATVDYNGQRVPWYGAPERYNPWSDFGSNMLQMMAINMMLNSMFQPHYSVIHHHHDHGGGYGGGYDNSGGYSGGGSNGTDGWANDNSGAGATSLDFPSGGGDFGDFGASSSLDLGGFDSGGGWGGDSS
jgi:cbb3-type cytochrome oxidase subunit 3